MGGLRSVHGLWLVHNPEFRFTWTVPPIKIVPGNPDSLNPAANQEVEWPSAKTSSKGVN
jgi:hypothetical protein